LRVGEEPKSLLEVFLVFLRLGLTSFGGPLAHLGYFRNEFVLRRKWISEENYSGIVALFQFLPGPASSQVGIAIGLLRRGYLGAFCAWAGFTFPSALFLMLASFGFSSHQHLINQSVLRGLKLVSVAVVAQALWGMANLHCKRIFDFVLVLFSAAAVFFYPSAYTPLLIILTCALLGQFQKTPSATAPEEPLTLPISSRAGAFWLVLLGASLILFPILRILFSSPFLSLWDSFFRVGSVVFGGGHVVLPLLHSEFVSTGQVSNSAFVAGYGLAQAVPGPLFTFAAYLGASSAGPMAGLPGATTALFAIFTPAFLLVFGGLPFFQNLRKNTQLQAAFLAINASVVGLLLAAFCDPVLSSAVHKPIDVGFALTAFVCLAIWNWPPWLVVSLGGLLGFVLGKLP
jgi:chromate transporter